MSKLNVYINADASQAIEAFGKLKDKTTDLEKGFDKIGKSFDKFGSLAAKSLTVPIAAGTTAFALATKKAIDFDNGMRKILSLLPNLSKDSLNVLRDDLLDFAKEAGKAPEEVVTAAYDALSAGVPEDNLFEFLEQASKGAVAGVTDMSVAVDGLTSVVNAYGQETLSFQNASDVIFSTIKIGKASYEELAGTLYNVIPTASAIGVKFEDIGAAIALMTSMGTPTAQATTQIRQALVELNKEGSTADNTFKEISGKSFKEFIQEGGNLQEALQMMEESARANGKEVTSMFSSVEAGNAVLSLSGKNAKAFKETLEEMNKSAGATNEAFKAIDDGPARQFERIKAETEALVIELGNNLLPVAEESLLPFFKDSLIPTAEKLINTIGALIGAFNNLPAPMQAVSAGTVGLIAGFGPALKGIVGLSRGMSEAKKTISDFKNAVNVLKTSAGSIQALSTAWKALNTVMIASPVGIITALTVGLGALAVKAYKLNQEYRALIETSNQLADSTKELNDNAFKDVGLFEEYQKLASAKELDAAATERLSQVTDKLTRLYPNLKTVVLDGITYIDSAAMKLEDYRTAEESIQIQTIETKIKELEEKRKTYNAIVESKRSSLYAVGMDKSQANDEILKSSDYEKLSEAENTLRKLEKQRNDLNGMRQLRQSLTRDGIDLETKEKEANEKSINAIKGKSDAVKTSGKTYKDYLALLRNKPFLFICLAHAMITFITGGLSAWMPTYLHRYLEMDVARAGTVFGLLVVVCGALGTYLGGKIADKLLPITPKAYFWVMAAALILLLPPAWLGVQAQTAWIVLTWFGVAVIFLFLPTGPIAAALVSSTRTKVHSMAFAVNIFIIHALGDALSPMLVGQASYYCNLKTAVLLCCLATIPGLLFTWLAARLERRQTLH